jgi:segregation and condensation protein B
MSQAMEDVGQEAHEAPGEAEVTAQSVVEAVLFCAEEPLAPAKIAQILGTGDARDVRKHVDALNQRYEQMGCAFRIESIAGGYQMLTLAPYAGWVEKLRRVRAESKLSPAALETLAVIAYRQPVPRADIEAVRGVAVGEVLNRLREMGLVKVVGRAEDVGRPMLYGTTKMFLEVFGLNDLSELPKVEQLKPPDQT